MKRIFTLLVSAFLFTMVMGQQPSATVKKASVAPVIDGNIDDVWAEAEQIPITVPTGTNTPTTGDSWFKLLWNEDGIYLLTFVDDDVFVPAYMGTPVADQGQTWMFDKLEIYFDCNYLKADTKGASANSGHYQIAPTEIEATVNGGTAKKEDRGEVWSYNATDAPHYYEEFFFPFTMLKDQEGTQVDVTEPIGFDVVINDNDILTINRNRMNWANAGDATDNWANMDAAGLITLEGAVAPTLVETVAITGGAVTTDNGTFQIPAVIAPEDATIKGLKYSITGGTGMASVSDAGVVTGIKDGPVTIRAAATDGSQVESNEVTITVSGQNTTLTEVSYIKDGDFTQGTATKQSSFWTGGAAEAVEDGVYTIVNPTLSADPWGYSVTQVVHIPMAMKDLAYVLQFKAWADEDRIFDCDFEHGDPNYARFGDTPDANSDGGKSQWTYNLTTEPTVYTQTITEFSRMEEPQPQKFNLFAGRGTAKVYIDNIVLVTKEDFDKYATNSVKNVNASAMRVYPNPVGAQNQLNVNTGSVNAKVAIFNSLGQKMMEKVSTGNVAKFDVSSLAKGMYVVKLSDGTAQKFVK